jgi:hypothetical protein
MRRAGACHLYSLSFSRGWIKAMPRHGEGDGSARSCIGLDRDEAWSSTSEVVPRACAVRRAARRWIFWESEPEADIKRGSRHTFVQDMSRRQLNEESHSPPSLYGATGSLTCS